MRECALPPSDFSPTTFSASSASARTRGRPRLTSLDLGSAPPRVFTPALLLPVQLAHPPADSWLRRLCLALLADALACLEGKGPSRSKESPGQGARRAQEAWRWVWSDAQYCLSFVTVCAVLQLDAQAVRQHLRHAGGARRLRLPRSRGVAAKRRVRRRNAPPRALAV